MRGGMGKGAGQGDRRLRFAKRKLLSFALCLLPFTLMMAPACSTTKGAAVKKDPDPLLGDTTPKKTPDPLKNTQANSVPPVPIYQASISNAGLAMAQPLDGPRTP